MGELALDTLDLLSEDDDLDALSHCPADLPSRSRPNLHDTPGTTEATRSRGGRRRLWQRRGMHVARFTDLGLDQRVVLSVRAALLVGCSALTLVQRHTAVRRRGRPAAHRGGRGRLPAGAGAMVRPSPSSSPSRKPCWPASSCSSSSRCPRPCCPTCWRRRWPPGWPAASQARGHGGRAERPRPHAGPTAGLRVADLDELPGCPEPLVAHHARRGAARRLGRAPAAGRRQRAGERRLRRRRTA